VLAGPYALRLVTVYLLAVALGFVNVLDNPARQSFISELVPPDDLPNAVTLNSVSMNIARVFGAALGGVVAAAFGLVLCFGLNAVSFGAVLASLAVMRAVDLSPARRVTREPGQIRQGLRYVRGTPELLIPLVMIAVIGALAWEFPVSLPLMASKVFGGGAAAYGVMASVMGVGAVAGGLVSAGRGLRATALCLSAVGWGICDPPRGGGAHDAARTGRAHLRRVRQHHVQLDGQDGAAACREADDARPGDGAVGAGAGSARRRSAAPSSAGSARTRAPAGRSWSAVWLRSFAACSPSRPSPASTAAVPPRIAFHDHEGKARV
jgi:hypothetical protein